MGKKITFETEKAVLQLLDEKISISEISRRLKISRPTIYTVLNTYRVPICEEIKKKKSETINIIDVLSLRLWYFCEDYKLLTQMFALEICLQECNKIFVPKKMTKIININKIKKVIGLVNQTGLKCELCFA